MKVTRRQFIYQTLASVIAAATYLVGWFKSSGFKYGIHSAGTTGKNFGEKSMTVDGNSEYLEVNADEFDLFKEDFTIDADINMDDGDWHRLFVIRNIVGVKSIKAKKDYTLHLKKLGLPDSDRKWLLCHEIEEKVYLDGKEISGIVFDDNYEIHSLWHNSQSTADGWTEWFWFRKKQKTDIPENYPYSKLSRSDNAISISKSG